MSDDQARRASTTGAPGSAPATGSGRPSVPGRRQLVGGVVMVIIGSFMPWIETQVGSISGARGAGLWTFYAAMFGLAGAIVPVRTLALVQGAVLAVVAISLPLWQVARLVGLVGFGGWMPGAGMLFVFTGGVIAAVATHRMRQAAWPTRVSRRG